jgi:leader peptidase (prepilin peptidase)/N-methyltransferase
LVIGLIFMDAATGLLPREFTYSGIVIGIVFSWIIPTNYAATELLLRLYGQRLQNIRWISLLDSVLASAVGAGFFYLAWALYYLVRKKHGLGFGDIALMAMSGAFLGLELTLLVIFCAPLLGVFYAVFLLARQMLGSNTKLDSQPDPEKSLLAREIPFGVFLGICSLGAVFFGESVWNWYLRML